MEELRLRETVDRMRAEIEALERKLGELHGTEINGLRRAYRSLSQHVDALERESAGMVEQLREFEIGILPPELVARELGVTAAVAIGVSVLSHTARALPIKSTATVAKGLWLLGGAFVLFRLGAGALAHVALMLDRNARRKRRLIKKLEAVQERVHIMSALQQWADKQVPPAQGAAAGGPPSVSEVEGEGVLVSPPPRISPTGSEATSEGELVERPDPPASRGAAPKPPARASSGALSGAAASSSAVPSRQQEQRPTASYQVDMEPLRTLARYARLGQQSGQQ